MERLAKRFPLSAALVHRDFRLYWGGNAFAVSGQQMAMMIQMWLIFDLTGSALQLGLLGLARAIPGVAWNLVGGVFADKVDQRKLLLICTLAMAIIYSHPCHSDFVRRVGSVARPDRCLLFRGV